MIETPETEAARKAFHGLQDQRRVGEHHAVVENQRRCLDQRIEGAEALEVAEYGHLLVLVRYTQQTQRNRHAPHVGRIHHADEFQKRLPRHDAPRAPTSRPPRTR